MRYPFLLAATLSTLLAAPVPAQGAWSSACDQPGLGLGGRVFHLGTYRNELIAGTYRSPWRDGNRLEHIGRFDGVRWYPLGSGVNGQVRSSLEFQGSLYVGGDFLQAGGSAASRIARWDGSRWQNVGAGFDGIVWALAEHQGQLYAAGAFTLSGSAAIAGIARWNGISWQAVGGGLQWTLGLNATGYALLSDGQRLYVGGEFDRAGATPASHIAAWDGSTWRALGGGMNNFGYGWVRTLTLHLGQLYAGGVFGQAGTAAADNVAVWNGTGWSAVGAGLQGSGYGASIWSLRSHQGSLFAGGAIERSGNTVLNGVARFDGAAWQSIGGVAVAENNPPAVIAMATWNNQLYCGGEFRFAGPLTAQDFGRAVYHVAAWDGSRWSAAGGGLGFDDEVHAFGRFQGDVIAAGRFIAAGGEYASCLARFDGDDWQLFGGFDGLIRDMTVHNNELWVAGEFYRVNGVVADGVARFDGAAWHAVGGGPGPHRANCIASYQGSIYIGTSGSPLVWTGTAWQTFTPPIYGSLTCMHVHNNVLYMGGATPFHPGAPNLFAWNGATLSIPGAGLDGSVESLGSHNGNLVVGGRFTRAGNLPARCIASWNGSAWSTFGIGIRGASVMAITTFQGALVVGGDFSAMQGETADYVARWTGASWQPIGATAPNGAVFALLADDARGELHVGGWYSRNGAQDDAYYSLWQNTPAWTDVAAATGSARRAPHLSGDGSLLPGARTRWRLSSALENAPAAFVLGFQRIDQPLLGCTLIPRPDFLLFGSTDAIGTMSLQLPWPGIAGARLFAQGLVLDAGGPQGATASNGVWLRAP